MRHVVALPGWAMTGAPVCCTYWVTSQGGGALVVGKPMMLVRCDWMSVGPKGTTVIDTGMPLSTVLPKASVTIAVMVLRCVPSLLSIANGLTVRDRRPGRPAVTVTSRPLLMMQRSPGVCGLAHGWLNWSPTVVGISACTTIVPSPVPERSWICTLPAWSV